MNKDRVQEFFIDVDGVRWPAIRIAQYVHIGGEYHQPHGFPYCPARVFTGRVVDGLTLEQSYLYFGQLSAALELADKWEAERRKQES